MALSRITYLKSEVCKAHRGELRRTWISSEMRSVVTPHVWERVELFLQKVQVKSSFKEPFLGVV